MHYWRDNYFKSLKDVAAEAAATSPAWQEYADFCLEYERGLRHNAFAHLERFISRMKGASFTDRRRFVSWLLTNTNEREGQHMLVPYPLKTAIVQPTLQEWIELEPNNTEANRWLGDDDHLERALDLDPNDQIARKRFIISLLSRVGFASHELPLGFIGSADEALATLARVESLLPELTDLNLRAAYAEAVDEERAAIREHLLHEEGNRK